MRRHLRSAVLLCSLQENFGIVYLVLKLADVLGRDGPGDRVGTVVAELPSAEVVVEGRIRFLWLSLEQVKAAVVV